MMKKNRGLRLTRVFKWLLKGRQRSRPSSNPVTSAEKPTYDVPKGHLAVYVGDQEHETSRVFVPVIYFNHPLFVELLKEAEMVYGFNHKKGIQIPCKKSQFENVKMRIAAAARGGDRLLKRGWCWIR